MILLALTTGLWVVKLRYNGDEDVMYKTLADTFENRINLLVVTITLIISGLIVYMLRKESSSQKLRKIVFERHVIYCSIYLLDSICIRAMYVTDEPSHQKVIWTILYFSGIPLALARLSEPFVWALFKHKYIKKTKTIS